MEGQWQKNMKVTDESRRGTPVKRLITVALVLALALPCCAVADGKNNAGLDMTFWEQFESSSVEYIKSWDFFYYKGRYCLRFMFADGNKKEKAVPARVDIEVSNDDGKTVYSGEHDVTAENYLVWTKFGIDKTYATIFIEEDDITKGATGSGTVKFKVYSPGYFEFEDIEIESDELPKIDITELCQLEMPETPIELESDSVLFGGKVRIDEISYTFEEYFDGNVELHLYFTGERVETENDGGDSIQISWKLYDEDDYVVDTGTTYVWDVAAGEKFRDFEYTIYDLAPEAYRLKLYGGG